MTAAENQKNRLPTFSLRRSSQPSSTTNTALSAQQLTDCEGRFLGRDAIWALTESCRSSSSCDVRGVGSSWLTVSYIFLTPSFALRSSPRRVSQLSVHCFYIGVSIFGSWSVSVYWVTSEDRKPVGKGKFVGALKSRTLRRRLT